MLSLSKPSSPTGRIRHLRLFEAMLYVIFLIAALGIPFFLGVFTELGWKGVLFDWMRLLPFALIFLVSNCLLVPRLLFRDKYLKYFLSCILSVITVVYLSGFLLDTVFSGLSHFDGIPPRTRMPSDNMHPPAGRTPRQFGQLNPSPDNMPLPAGEMEPQPFHKPGPPAGFAGGKPFHPFFHFGLAIIAFLLIGFNAGIKSFVRWSEEKIRQAERERQYYYAELAFLKHQINPHFFMNTLNNIHALVDINAREAKGAIIKLSHLMRYLLYESDEQNVSLRKEIDFIESYIELMRLRYDEANLAVETEYPDNMESVAVPSSLFLSFIENAFKYGVHTSERSLIKIRFSVENDRLSFSVLNNRWDVISNQTGTTGIGLENVRKRLDLIYRDNYTLDFQVSGDFYLVNLKIPVA